MDDVSGRCRVVRLHLGMLRWIPDHSLNILTAFLWVLRSVTVDAIRVASSAYHLLESARWLEVSV